MFIAQILFNRRSAIYYVYKRAYSCFSSSFSILIFITYSSLKYCFSWWCHVFSARFVSWAYLCGSSSCLIGYWATVYLVHSSDSYSAWDCSIRMCCLSLLNHCFCWHCCYSWLWLCSGFPWTSPCAERDPEWVFQPHLTVHWDIGGVERLPW